MVLVLPVGMRLPFTSSHMARLCGSRISSAVTSHGPSGAKVSNPLPLSQVGPRSSCHSRSDTSLQIKYPATQLKASASETLCAFLPITNASSTSQSPFFEPLGRITASLGPLIDVV